MFWFAVLIPISFILVSLAKASPQAVEDLYSLGVYRYISQPLSKITGVAFLSLGELLFYTFIAWVVLKLFALARALFLKNKELLSKTIAQMIAALSILLFLFVMLWGLNYYRMPLSQSANLDTEDHTAEDLRKLCNYLIKEANSYRDKIKEDSGGVMKLSQNKNITISRAHLGYESISSQYPMLEGNYGKPKIVLGSKLMSYAGIAGIFFPFTIEANVNGDLPEVTLPSTIAHEMAHQRGYAREDEANFISFLTCMASPDIEYKYSGTILALIHSINALHGVDKDKALELAEEYSPGLERDLADINAYWKKFEGPIERTSTRLNNTYLKANNQKDGVKSYGRMVDLLLSYYKSKILD